MVKALIFVFLFSCAAWATYAFFHRASVKEIGLPEATEAPPPKEPPATSKLQNKRLDDPVNSANTPRPEPDPEQETIILTAENMQENILKCFQGYKCELSENAWSLYQELKNMKNPKVIDLYLSYLRSKLKDPEYRDVYRNDLKNMIDDFYPAQEKEFQDAAYYAYLGEPQKSLDLYMDLRQRSDNDPTLRQPPNMNVANVLYDLDRKADSLTYYEMAYEDLEGKANRSELQEETMRFLETRIEEIRKSLPKDPNSEEESSE